MYLEAWSLILILFFPCRVLVPLLRLSPSLHCLNRHLLCHLHRSISDHLLHSTVVLCFLLLRHSLLISSLQREKAALFDSTLILFLLEWVLLWLMDGENETNSSVEYVRFVHLTPEHFHCTYQCYVAILCNAIKVCAMMKKKVKYNSCYWQFNLTAQQMWRNCLIFSTLSWCL